MTRVAILLLGVALLPLTWRYIPPAARALRQGSDDGARKAIAQVRPAYSPWAEPLWSPSTPVGETLLFTAQAVGGVAFFLFAVRRLRRAMPEPEQRDRINPE